MQGLLTSLLFPTFQKMGVSESDFQTYLGKCMPYIWGLLAAFVLMIIAIIVAKFLKKGKKAFAR